MSTTSESHEPGTINCEADSLDRSAAPIMFVFSVGTLVVLGLFLHLTAGTFADEQLRGVLGRLLLSVYWIFPAEFLMHWLLGRRITTQHLLAVFLPVIRFGSRDHRTGELLWFPLLGWRCVDANLEQQLQRLFVWPIMILAVLVLPLIGIEYAWSEAIASSPFWTQTLELVSAAIWIAFVLEYVTMVSIVKNKRGYVLRHWLDLIVILLPVLAFLRAAQIGRLARIKDLSRTVRAYRLKGLTTRWWRAILALDVIDRFAKRDLDNYIASLEVQLTEKHSELARLEKRIELARAELDKTKAAKAKNKTSRGETEKRAA